MQLAHPKVAQPKLGAYSAPSLLLVSSTHPARMPDGPAKKPGDGPYCNLFLTVQKKKSWKNQTSIWQGLFSVLYEHAEDPLLTDPESHITPKECI